MIDSQRVMLVVWLFCPCTLSTLGQHNADLLYSYHIYGLVVVLHSQIYAGVTLIVLPKFDLTQFLTITAKYKVDVHCRCPLKR